MVLQRVTVQRRYSESIVLNFRWGGLSEKEHLQVPYGVENKGGLVWGERERERQWQRQRQTDIELKEDWGKLKIKVASRFLNRDLNR